MKSQNNDICIKITNVVSDDIYMKNEKRMKLLQEQIVSETGKGRYQVKLDVARKQIYVSKYTLPLSSTSCNGN